MGQPSRKELKLKRARRAVRDIRTAANYELRRAQYAVQILSQQAEAYRGEIIRLRGILHEHKLDGIADAQRDTPYGAVYPVPVDGIVEDGTPEDSEPIGLERESEEEDLPPAHGGMD